MAADAGTHVEDPALGVPSDRAAGRAIAAETTAMAMAWKLAVGGGFLDRPTVATVAHAIVMMTATFAVSLLLGRVAARAQRGRGAVGRALGLGMIGGAAVMLVSAPLSHVGSTWAPGLTWMDILLNDLFCGAFLGFFAGVGVSPLAVHHVRLRSEGALDFTPRIHVAAGAALIVPCLLALVFGAWMPGIPLLVGSLALAALALRDNRRRLDWMARVRAGEVAGHRLDEVAPSAEVAELPAFTGKALDARGVLLRAPQSEDRGAHPFRAGEAWIPVARMTLDASAAALEAQASLRRLAHAGALAGALAVLAIGLPMLLFVMAISA